MDDSKSKFVSHLKWTLNTSFVGERRISNLMGKPGSVGKWGILEKSIYIVILVCR
jgi:hypothetical protein